jgi:hypothetical protein
MDLYVRLSAVFNGQYIIAPQVLARDLVELELEDEPVAPVDVLQAQQYADEFVFDFVLSDAHTGELVLAMINEDAISAQPEGEFIIALLKELTFLSFAMKRCQAWTITPWQSTSLNQ